MSKSGRSLLDWLSLNRTELGLLLAIVLVFVLAGTIDPQHTYFDFSARRGAELSFKDILRQTSMLGIFALGSAVVIISGGIDLSCGSVIAFSGSVCATLMLLMAPEAMTGGSELSLGVIAAAIVGTVLVGFLIGSLHAWLITVIGLPPFVATLATLVGLRSLGRSIIERVTNRMLDGTSTQIQIFDDRFRYLATSIWIPALIFAVLAVLFWLLLSRTVTGRHLYALGGNEQAAHLSGISTTRLKWLAYTLGAVTSSIAGILYIGDQAVADPQTLGRGYELNAIAAAVVGGCSLQGGVGTIPGTVLGVIFLRTVIDGIAKIIKTGADVYEGLIVGILVVVAVAFNQLRTAGSGRKRFFADALGIVAGVTLVILSALVCWLMAGDTPGVIGGTLALAAIVVLKLLEARAARRGQSDARR
ncbi:MAG: ABC transporter permease [Planctomycetales bacterium]|nr:ABC transporter permease [Planctomycetales bacterium]